ncbi:SOS response-associated peptidase [Pseudooceanicola nanhaiensis]|uniref:SOS response-associated peptidase n=1 Tax=Pseudooceanicola nanhaiensis TaxID=375761 RepID=UPI001CD693B4|nr:SOS response-associated peptidase [Pseudooceanicola nanhaiensis]MCA0919926.1 SOS response-associated peptidase [Pseudooceanicola nanhaiensis]
MCGRFVDPNLRGTEFEHSELRIDPIPRRFNVKPTQDVLLFAKPELVAYYARWWLVPSWHKGELKEWKATTFNARIEEAAQKPTFRAVWRHGRCLIPAGAYYEWTGEKGAKQPHVFSAAGNEETLWFAGLASRWNELLTCTILTRAANADVEAIHHRMPVILNAEERDAWLGGTDETELLGAEARLRHHPVARFGMKDDGPELIEPAE